MEYTKEEILSCGKYLKSTYGICKEFKCDRYEYKGRRFDISTFNEEVEELPNLQCNCCGNSYFQPYINIMLICKKCYKEYSK